MASLQKIAPAVGTLNLDLIRDTTGPARFQIRDGLGGNLTATLGSLLNATTIGTGNNDPKNPVQLLLVRRQNLGRPMPTNPVEEADNPWVIVDQIRLPELRQFELKSSDTAPEIQTQLARLTSGQRVQPSQAGRNGTNYFEEPAYAPAGNVSNSLGGNNLDGFGNAFGPYFQWQAHFDRDFASAGELLSIPVFGSDTMTLDLWESRRPFVMRATTDPNATPLLASDLFLFPDFPDALNYDANGDTEVNQTYAEMLANRWYRLLEFVEVPSRTHRGLSPEFNNPLNVIRQPGQINLNNVRHPEVMAGLIDDKQVIDRSFAGGSSYLPDQTGDAARDWWTQFIQSRDGITTGSLRAPDPVTGMYLPGVPGSHPFRSLGFLGQ